MYQCREVGESDVVRDWKACEGIWGKEKKKMEGGVCQNVLE